MALKEPISRLLKTILSMFSPATHENCMGCQKFERIDTMHKHWTGGYQCDCCKGVS